MGSLAPILLFVYKRLDTLKQVVESLKNNFLVEDSVLYLFSDAPKSEEDGSDVVQVRKFIQTITGFKEIHIFQSCENKGLAKSIIWGVTEVMKKYDKVIVIEDDLVTSPNFLTFMNQALDFYQNNPLIISVCGYSVPIKKLNCNDVYFTLRSSSWGWGTWRNRWIEVDWNVSGYQSFSRDSRAKKQFNKMGSDMTGMLMKQMNNKLDSWAIRFCFHQFKNNLFSVHPAVSKVVNKGTGTGATHTFDNRYSTNLDAGCSVEFNFTTDVKLDPDIIRSFIRPYSIPVRCKYKFWSLIRQVKRGFLSNFSVLK